MPSQKNHIPLLYRIAFNWVEPIFAFGGALQAYFAPKDLLAIATPNVKYNESMHPIFTQLAGGWCLLAFNDAVTLRLTQDVRIWTSLLTAGIISDLIYTFSLYEDLGAARFWNPLVWNSNDWLTIMTTIPPMLVKFAFVARIGLEDAWRATKTKSS